MPFSRSSLICSQQLIAVKSLSSAYWICPLPSTPWTTTSSSTGCTMPSAGRRHLHSAARGDLAVPATRTLRYSPRSFFQHQYAAAIRILSWSENWTVYQSTSPACSWLFLAVRAGEHNSSTHHHHHALWFVKVFIKQLFDLIWPCDNWILCI